MVGLLLATNNLLLSNNTHYYYSDTFLQFSFQLLNLTLRVHRHQYREQFERHKNKLYLKSQLETRLLDNIVHYQSVLSIVFLNRSSNIQWSNNLNH